jgi:hypothetical protein
MDTAMNVRVIVAMTDNDQQPDPRTIGLCLHPEDDQIVGAIPGTPAGEWAANDPQGLADFVGMPWHPDPKSLEELGLVFHAGTQFPQRNSVIDGSLSPRPERKRVRRRRPTKGRKKR